ncbi:MAG: serine/threonine-protein kinase [Acidobacteria bacterium]|nr:serine/threonine-protein kinase [Acidobacteriota bacterium]
MEIQLEDSSSPRRSATGLSVGDRLGRFEILGPLGAGGMGDVYRARDSQLLREVAIKVLPTAFLHDPDRQRRFEREARATASLNHPHIVSVYDVGVHQGVPFIVTELLEGETLRQRMNGRPLPARRALEYGIQIASGLAAGHERGIVHRDIKPDNLFVTKDGRVKILDFGLARMIDPDSSADATATITLDGVPLAPVVGTAAYMSPEQARGLRTDHRSDIFSLGVVLYEMLAGFAPFRRSTPAETLGAILHDAPPELTSVAPVGSAVERIVRHCLEKAPEERFQSVRDLAFALEALPPAAWTTGTSRLRQRISRRRASIALMVLAVTVAALLGYRAGQGVIQSAGILERPTPLVQRLTELPGIEQSPALSPDRRQVAFTATVKGRRQIFVRLLAGGPPVQITSDAVDHEFPRWSPDANALVYFSPARSDQAQGEIWSIPALGGSPRRVIDSIGGADVGRNGRLACFRLVGRDVQLVTSSLDGTGLQVIAQSVAGYHQYPRWSPDGRWVAFQKGDGLRFDIFVIPHGGGEPRKLTGERSIIKGLAWLPDNSGIVYASSRGSTVPYLPPLALWEVRLDGSHRQITPVDAWYDQPDIHSSGLMSAARMRMRFDIWRFPFDRGPTENVRRAQQVTRQTGQVLTPTSSPDGSEMAFLSDSGGHGNLWVMSIQTGQLRQITFEADPGVTVGAPVWSPDGRSVAFVSSKGRGGFDFGVWLVNPDGTNPRNLVEQGLGMAWSPDGQWVYYAESSAGPLYKVSASGGTPMRIRSEPTRNVIGLHDTTLYYIVERALLNGRPEIEIRAATPEDGPSRMLARLPASRVPSWQIVNPALSPNGEWLAMPLTDGFTTNIWALSTRTGAWRQVTDFGERATFIARRVSWSSDGGSILAAVAEGDADVVLLSGLIGRP